MFLKACLDKSKNITLEGLCPWRFTLIAHINYTWRFVFLKVCLERSFFFLYITLEGFVKYLIVFPFQIIQVAHLTWRFILVNVNINLEGKPISVQGLCQFTPILQRFSFLKSTEGTPFTRPLERKYKSFFCFHKWKKTSKYIFEWHTLQVQQKGRGKGYDQTGS